MNTIGKKILSYNFSSKEITYVGNDGNNVSLGIKKIGSSVVLTDDSSEETYTKSTEVINSYIRSIILENSGNYEVSDICINTNETGVISLMASLVNIENQNKITISRNLTKQDFVNLILYGKK